jgi:hypothetical protein
MRTLGSGLGAAIARTITEPRFFLEIGFATPVRLTTDVTQSWNSQTWTEAQFSVNGIRWDGSISQQVSIDIYDPLNAIAALALNEKLTNRDVKLWIFQRGDTSAGNVLQLPPLKGNDYSGKEFRVTITAGIAQERVIPGRTYRSLVPDILFAEDETVYRWGNGTITLKPRSAL